MSYFELRGKLCYFEEKGDGTSIIFLHGNTASSNMFIGIKNLFSKNFKVIILDFL